MRRRYFLPSCSRTFWCSATSLPSSWYPGRCSPGNRISDRKCPTSLPRPGNLGFNPASPQEVHVRVLVVPNEDRLASALQEDGGSPGRSVRRVPVHDDEPHPRQVGGLVPEPATFPDLESRELHQVYLCLRWGLDSARSRSQTPPTMTWSSRSASSSWICWIRASR